MASLTTHKLSFEFVIIDWLLWMMFCRPHLYFLFWVITYLFFFLFSFLFSFLSFSFHFISFFLFSFLSFYFIFFLSLLFFQTIHLQAIHPLERPHLYLLFWVITYLFPFLFSFLSLFFLLSFSFLSSNYTSASYTSKHNWERGKSIFFFNGLHIWTERILYNFFYLLSLDFCRL